MSSRIHLAPPALAAAVLLCAVTPAQATLKDVPLPAIVWKQGHVITVNITPPQNQHTGNAAKDAAARAANQHYFDDVRYALWVWPALVDS